MIRGTAAAPCIEESIIHPAPFPPAALSLAPGARLHFCWSLGAGGDFKRRFPIAEHLRKCLARPAAPGGHPAPAMRCDGRPWGVLAGTCVPVSPCPRVPSRSPPPRRSGREPRRARGAHGGAVADGTGAVPRQCRLPGALAGTGTFPAVAHGEHWWAAWEGQAGGDSLGTNGRRSGVSLPQGTEVVCQHSAISKVLWVTAGPGQ